MANRGAGGRLAVNILYFARALRRAGMPVGPGAIVDAVRAVEAAGIGDKADFYAVLHAVLVKRREHTALFDQVFRLFWRRRALLDQLAAGLAPLAPPRDLVPPEVGARRVAEALFGKQKPQEADERVAIDARLTSSQAESLRRKDFAQMSAEEMAWATAQIAKLRLADDEKRTRRWRVDPHGADLDPRRSIRRSLRAGGHSIELVRRARARRPRPIVMICDISGSMTHYSQAFLHFAHALMERRRQAHVFLFGTRLTNVTRALRARDVEEALARVGAEASDWAGGTRIAACLRAFNRQWSRRVLGQGAIVILFTDGLERDDPAHLSQEMERLQKSSSRLIWLNPLLRYEQFEPKAQGVRAMLPYVDDFRPAHNLANIEDLCRSLDARARRGMFPARIAPASARSDFEDAAPRP